MWDALRCWIQWLAKTLYYYMVEAGEFFIDALGAIVNAVLWLLPTVALPDPNVDSGVLAALNYVLPISLLTGVFSAIMLAWILYRVYQWVLRWGKAEE